MSGKLDFVYVLDNTVAYLKMQAPGVFELSISDKLRKKITLGRPYAIVDSEDIDSVEVIGTLLIHGYLIKDGLEDKQISKDIDYSAIKAEVLGLYQMIELKKQYSVCLI